MAIAFFLCLFYALRIFHGVKEISGDGSMLFYNGPVYAKSRGGEEYVAYLDRRGGNWLHEINSDKKLLVHDYHEQALASEGLADDHAAPAVISVNGDELLYATAYHGTDLHIYRIKNMHVVDHVKIAGNYTYPMLFDVEGVIWLIVREQPAGKNGGDLVVFKSTDGFEQKNIAISASADEVVYAAVPFIDENGIVITYALHKYKDQSMRDFYVDFFDLSFNKIQHCDLGSLVEGAFYNRPTAVSRQGARVLLGTSWFDEAAFSKAEHSVFGQRNTVVIAEGQTGECDSFEKVLERKVAAPYYNTDVHINENLDFIFFGERTYFSNLNFEGCFLDGKNIYPRMVGGDTLIFSRMNGAAYNIRDFDNSLYVCRANIGDFH